MSGDHHFGKGSLKIFDLLIYRCQEKQYQEELERDVDRHIRKFDPGPTAEASMRRDWTDKHGGPWTFNEAVGLISIFVAPLKIGGLFYFPEERIRKNMKRRRLFLRGKLFEVPVWLEEDAETIYLNLRRWLSNTISHLPSLRGRVIDFEPLDTLGPHIDWIGITRPPPRGSGRRAMTRHSDNSGEKS
jgi:hypothetical protein